MLSSESSPRVGTPPVPATRMAIRLAVQNEHTLLASPRAVGFERTFDTAIRRSRRTLGSLEFRGHGVIQPLYCRSNLYSSSFSALVNLHRKTNSFSPTDTTSTMTL